ncbi:MAG: NADH:ubiquinone reductase (Na(+)-transporting) subunit C [Simkaniaceae bacterium]
MPEKSISNLRTVLFVMIISLTCAITLSLLSILLEKPKSEAKKLFQSKQLLIAAKLLTYQNQPIIGGNAQEKKASDAEILALFNERINAYLTDKEGQLYTFKEKKIDQREYIQNYEKSGYSQLPLKLIYLIKGVDGKPAGFVIPINGYGLWDALYGYLALSSDADHVIGTTWYDQKETPGLGAEIGSEKWQSQFYNKVIFQKNDEGQTDFRRAPLGFTIVKTSVKEVYGDSSKAESAIDGVTGATATMNGVTDAYRNSLTPYRPFLIKAHNKEINYEL